MFKLSTNLIYDLGNRQSSFHIVMSRDKFVKLIAINDQWANNIATNLHDHWPNILNEFIEISLNQFQFCLFLFRFENEFSCYLFLRFHCKFMNAFDVIMLK